MSVTEISVSDKLTHHLKKTALTSRLFIRYYTDFAIRAFRTYLCMMVLACVNKACFIFLQAIGKALASTMLSMFREVVFGVGFALLLPIFFGLDGVLYSMPLSDILTFIISVFIIVRTYRELHTEGEKR